MVGSAVLQNGEYQNQLSPQKTVWPEHPRVGVSYTGPKRSSARESYQRAVYWNRGRSVPEHRNVAFHVLLDNIRIRLPGDEIPGKRPAFLPQPVLLCAHFTAHWRFDGEANRG